MSRKYTRIDDLILERRRNDPREPPKKDNWVEDDVRAASARLGGVSELERDTPILKLAELFVGKRRPSQPQQSFGMRASTSSRP